jgi:hypothetical protein
MGTKTIARCLAAAGAATLAITLLWPAPAEGYSFLGGALRLSQRDVRVFDNFSDPESNNNSQPDPSFPGATGATLAIWKAAVEWGSQAHGDGLGDPSQPALGSGGANFDYSWQGNATSVGDTNGNTVSEISGQGGGVFAYTELPISDGWRIRFYADSAIWEDGPGSYPGTNNRHDIQGVATHELGHALGLGHSGDLSATMLSFLVGTGIDFRSIEADDIAGIQALYGARASDKPHVQGYALSGGSVTVTGSGFSTQGNEVWFTRRAPHSDGTPLKVAGLASFDHGTTIQLAIPDEAGPGDLLVHSAGSGGASLSNAFPFDPSIPPCPAPELYGTAKRTSQGTLPALYFQGRPSLMTDDFVVATAGGVPDQRGFLLSSAAQGATPFLGGTLWLARPLRREQRFQLDFTGGVTLSLPVTPEQVGMTRFYQLWFHDPGDPFGAGLSDGLRVTYCP